MPTYRAATSLLQGCSGPAPSKIVRRKGAQELQIDFCNYDVVLQIDVFLLEASSKQARPSERAHQKGLAIDLCDYNFVFADRTFLLQAPSKQHRSPEQAHPANLDLVVLPN
jgi:hypothetical protein